MFSDIVDISNSSTLVEIIRPNGLIVADGLVAKSRRNASPNSFNETVFLHIFKKVNRKDLLKTARRKKLAEELNKLKKLKVIKKSLDRDDDDKRVGSKR